MSIKLPSWSSSVYAVRSVAMEMSSYVAQYISWRHHSEMRSNTRPCHRIRFLRSLNMLVQSCVRNILKNHWLEVWRATWNAFKNEATGHAQGKSGTSILQLASACRIFYTSLQPPNSIYKPPVFLETTRQTRSKPPTADSAVTAIEYDDRHHHHRSRFADIPRNLAARPPASPQPREPSRGDLLARCRATRPSHLWGADRAVQGPETSQYQLVSPARIAPVGLHGRARHQSPDCRGETRGRRTAPATTKPVLRAGTSPRGDCVL